ncbi:hypothetical protein ACQEV4_18140 [Streptomyces shenzhenensis]|uniref:hypothetical protein n=1 Tax=Streptomyces shenzhenensis TaxID=943815 RepID=UPI003D8C598D
MSLNVCWRLSWMPRTIRTSTVRCASADRSTRPSFGRSTNTAPLPGWPSPPEAAGDGAGVGLTRDTSAAAGGTAVACGPGATCPTGGVRTPSTGTVCAGAARCPVRTAGVSACGAGTEGTATRPTSTAPGSAPDGAATSVWPARPGTATSTCAIDGVETSTDRPIAGTSTRATDGAATSTLRAIDGRPTCDTDGTSTRPAPFTAGRSLTRAPTAGMSVLATAGPCVTDPRLGTFTCPTAGAFT